MKSNNKNVTHFGILLFVVSFVAAIALLWWTDATDAVDRKDATPVKFTIETGQGVREIANNLTAHKLIRSPTAFFLLVKFSGLEHSLQAGDFRINRSMDARTVANELTHGYTDVWVTTLEGWRVEEVANRLAKDVDIPESEFLKVAQEGFMFPDTYLIPPNATAGAIVKMFQANFDAKVPQEMRAAAAARNLSMKDVVTLASIVEREGRTDQDRPIIAGILFNRLDADWPLQVDASLQYALGYQAGEKSWWKQALTFDDKEVKSPYNTYTNPGLPPGPICNPGLSSIRAVIYPEKSEYMYYIHDPSGQAHYATTLEEHNANVARYLQ